MVKYLLHDMLGNVPVYEDGPKRAAPLMGSQVDRPAMLVADVAAFQPAVERQPVGGAADRFLPVRILGRAGEQHDPGRVAAQDALLLAADQFQQLVIEGHEGLAFHLVVAVAQVRGPGVVGDGAVEGQLQGIGDAQSAADQDERDQPVGGVLLPVEVAGDGTFAPKPPELARRARLTAGWDGRTGRETAVSGVPELDQDRGRDMGGLAGLAGLETVSEQLAGPIAVLRAEQARRQAGAAVTRAAWKNLVFTGGPGAGKTRAAKAVARIYTELGLLALAERMKMDDLVAHALGFCPQAR